GGFLPQGNYRFTVSGNTSIHDLAGLELDGDGDGQPGGNYVPPVTIPQPAADLNVTLGVDNSRPLEGGTVKYTITLDDLNGPLDAQNVQITDLLPGGLTFVSATPPGGTSYDQSTGVWNVGTIAAGTSVTLTLTATV